MREGGRIDLRGWELTERQHWDLKHNKESGFVDLSVIDPGMDNLGGGMSASMHQKKLGKETITVRSIYFFGKGPYIQLWRSDDYPPDEATRKLNYTRLKNHWWQDLFYKAVMFDEFWFKLDDSENIAVKKFYINKNEVKGIVIAVVEKNRPEIVIREYIIKK